jgi:hypothetical protein
MLSPLSVALPVPDAELEAAAAVELVELVLLVLVKAAASALSKSDAEEIADMDKLPPFRPG